YNLGLALLVKGQVDEAIDASREAIRLKNDFAEAHNNLGGGLLGKGQVDEAIAEFREAIRLDKGDTQAYFNLATALEMKQSWSEAIAAWTEVARLCPDDASVQNGFAWLLATCPDATFRNPKRAGELAQEAVKLAPEVGGFWNTLGVAHYRAGEWKAAITALEKS